MGDVTLILSQIEDGDGQSGARSCCRWCTTSCASWRPRRWPVRSPGKRSRPRHWCTRHFSGWSTLRRSNTGMGDATSFLLLPRP